MKTQNVALGKKKTICFLWNTHFPLYKNNIAQNNAYDCFFKFNNEKN